MTRSIAELEKQLLQAEAAPGEPLELIDALLALAWELRSADTPRANKIAKQARELAIEHGYTLGQAKAARTIAMTVTDVNSVAEIYGFAEEARTLFDQVGDATGRAGSRDFLASMHEFVGDLAGGLEWALDALSIAREAGDPVRQGYALSNIGGILATTEEVDFAIEELEEALRLFEGANHSDGVATICRRLSKVLQDAGRGEEALVFAERCLSLAKAEGQANQSEFLNWSALTVMAEVAEQRGEPAAEQLYRNALNSFSSAATRRILGATTQVALGRWLLSNGRVRDAESEIRDVLKRIGGNEVSVVAETEAHEALADVYEQLNDKDLTIRHLREVQRLKQRGEKRNSQNKLSQVKVRAAVEAAKEDARLQRQRFAELRGTQSKIVETQKMALLSKLAAGTAHELNTPLGVLRSNASLSRTAASRLLSIAEAHEALGEPAKRLLAVIDSCSETTREAIERLANVAQSFRRFTELDETDRRSFDVRVGLESALSLLTPTLPPSIQIIREFESVPKIEGWPRELNHAFITVLQNAAQAIDGEGQVTVSTATAKSHVLVRIADTGRGMTREQASKLFDVAWSQAGTRTEMRLGLSAAYATLQKHGGSASVDSELGAGTAITFSFPIPNA